MSIHSSGLGHDQALARIFYSPKETEALLGVSHATVYRLIKSKKIDAFKLGGKTMISAESIKRLVVELPPAAAK
jgi:excisionase family DNA binding protein